MPYGLGASQKDIDDWRELLIECSASQHPLAHHALTCRLCKFVVRASADIFIEWAITWLHEPFFRHQHEPPEGLRGYHQLRFLTTDPREEPPERWVEVFSFDVHGVSRELTVVEGSWLLEDDDHVLKIAFNDYCIVLEEAVLTLRGYAVQLPQWGPTQREDRELQLQAGQSCDSRPKWFPKLDRKRKLWARKADIMHQLDEEYLELAMDEDTRKPRPETSEYAQRILTELGDTFNSAATLGRIRKARENGWI